MLSDIGAQASGSYAPASGSGNYAPASGSSNYAAALGADDNYVTDAEKIVIGNTSNTNSGDVCTTKHANAGYLTSVTVPADHIGTGRMAHQSEGEIMGFGASGAPTMISAGTAGHVVTANSSGVPTFQAATGGGGGGVTVQEEGTALSTTATTLNFTGSAITASGTGATKTINVVANNYSHPTGAGNKHIPTGGSSGKFLKYSSSGTAQWATPSYIADTQRDAGDGLALDSNDMYLDINGQTEQIEHGGASQGYGYRDTAFIVDDPSVTSGNPLKKVFLYDFMMAITYNWSHAYHAAVFAVS